MLSARNIHFRYKKEWLFNELSFELDFNSSKNPVVGLLGKNGSGKTTLLKIISGLLFPDKGEVTLSSLPSAKKSVRFLEKVCFLPEKFSLPNVKISELKNHYGRFYPDFDEEKFYQSLDYLELAKDQNMTTLSFGQGKKAFIAFALATQCPLTILDEPTNGLDIPSKPRFKKLILKAHKNKRSSIIISSHQAADLQDIISQVMILNEGGIVFNQEVSDILQKLFFSLSVEKPSPSKDLILTFEEVAGYSALYKNSGHGESKLNLEILFQAFLEKREVINQFFEFDNSTNLTKESKNDI